jgi:hypothetical protein
MKSNNTNDELRQAPLLKGIPTHDPFVVPDGFFERFPHQVQDRLRKPEGFLVRTTRTLYGSAMVRWSGAIAGILLLAFGASILLNRAPNDKSSDQVAVQERVSDELDAGYLTESELLWYAEGSTELMAAAGSNMNADDLQHYLENEDLPLDLLSEEL